MFETSAPRPEIVPPAIVTPAETVSDDPAPSNFTVLAPIARALDSASVLATPSSSVPPEPEKLSDVAAVLESSNSRSFAPPPMVNARAPPLLTALVNSRVPPVAEIDPDGATAMPTLPKPPMPVLPDNLPWPVIVPPPSIRPAASVRVEAVPSSLTVLPPIVSALVSVSVLTVFNSKVPFDPVKLSPVAAVAASSNRRSVAPPPMDSAKALPVLAIVPVISKTPPLAAIVAAPVAPTVATTLPVPAILPVLRVRPAASVSVADGPSSTIALAPTANAAVVANVAPVFSSSVPVVPWKATEVAALVPSSSNLSVAPAPIVMARALPALVRVLASSSVPPVAATVAAPVAVKAAATLPAPEILPVLSVAPAAAVRVAPDPSSFTLFAPMASALVNVNDPAVLSSSVPVAP